MKILLPLIVIAACLGSLIYIIKPKNIILPGVKPTAPAAVKAKDRSDVLIKLEQNFSTIQSQITAKPTLGASRWYGPINVQFLSPEVTLISFEDGHIMGVAIIKYQPEEGGLQILSAAAGDSYNFSPEAYKNFTDQYRQPQFKPENYTKSIVENGEVQNFEDWTLVKDNLFVKN